VIARNLVAAGNEAGVTIDSTTYSGQGGGIYIGGNSRLDLFDSTVAGNHLPSPSQSSGGGQGPGIFGESSDRLNITNTIVISNTVEGVPAEVSPSIDGFSADRVTATFSDACQAPGVPITGTANVCVDPQLKSPFTPLADVQQTPPSPTINQGNNTLVPADLPTDYEGDARIIGAAVDMGADEFGSADVSVIKTDNPDPVQAGQQLTYTVTVTNSGPGPAHDVIVTDTLPAGVTFNSASAACSQAGGVVVCPLGDIAAGASVVVTIVVVPSTPGTITNTAVVGASTFDPDLANNSDSESTFVAFAGGGRAVCPGPFWFLAEGSTRNGIEEYILVFNTAAAATTVVLTYTVDGGPNVTRSYPLAGLTRLTVAVHDPANLGREHDHGTLIEAATAVLVERSMFVIRDVAGIAVNGDHNAIAESGPRPSWSFSEGTTLADFQTYFTVSNPTATATVVTATYGLDTGGTVTRTKALPALSRITLDAANPAEGPGPGVTGFATVLSATTAVLAERPVYFDHPFRFALGGVEVDVPVNGASDSFGVTPAPAWYLAEGNVLPDFDMFLTLGNPSPSAIDATITYNLENAAPIIKVAHIGANGRTTVQVYNPSDTSGAGIGRNVSDPISRGVGVVVQTSAPGGMVVERAMYFKRVFDPALPSIDDGHATAGYPGFEKTWYFAEGTGLADFRTFLTLSNPQSLDAHATITYFPDDGSGAVTKSVTIPATQRKTIQTYSATDPAGYAAGKTGFAMKVSSDLPLLAERPEYEYHPFDIGTVIGGNVSIGLPDACGRTFT
jgi:uncharacterized repeat protein (TIGR01451 family)